MFVIEKASIQKAKAKVAIIGPAGSGKTYTSLVTASELGKSIIVLDTENGSSQKYANSFTFDVIRMPSYSIEKYIEALEFVKGKGYDVVIIDSLSHAWAGKDGALEQVDKTTGFGGNKFAAWGKVTPLQNKLVDTILSYPSHLIATMRMKMEYALIEGEDGKKKPEKLGLGVVQRDSIEYEFDIIAEMDVKHNLIITKTRCFSLDGFMSHKPDNTFGRILGDWLSDGVAPPSFPDGWYPTKVEFFERAKEEFSFEPSESAKILKQGGFSSGYDVKNVSTMWKLLKEKFDSLSTEFSQVTEEVNPPSEGSELTDKVDTEADWRQELVSLVAVEKRDAIFFTPYSPEMNLGKKEMVSQFFTQVKNKLAITETEARTTLKEKGFTKFDSNNAEEYFFQLILSETGCVSFVNYVVGGGKEYNSHQQLLTAVSEYVGKSLSFPAYDSPSEWLNIIVLAIGRKRNAQVYKGAETPAEMALNIFSPKQISIEGKDDSELW